MRFLANENIPKEAIHTLRHAGFDVKSIAEDLPGISDKDVIALASDEQRIIMTFDRDYGELIFRYGQKRVSGVIYLHFVPENAQEPGSILKKVFKAGISFDGKFTVVGRDKMRQRPILLSEEK